MAFVAPVQCTAQSGRVTSHRDRGLPDGQWLGSRYLPSRHKRARNAPHARRVTGLRAAATQSAQPGIEQAWEPFRERMKATNESPPVGDWNELFRVALAAKDEPAAAIWVLDRMRETGRTATAGTYEILLEICLSRGDRAAAFLLVEKMWADKVLLGDVSLPDDMEKTLRAILPPEAFD